MKITYNISDLVPYVNWVYFFYAWQVKEEAEKQRLRQEAEVLLSKLEGRYHVYGIFELFDAYGEEDDIIIRGDRGKATGRRVLLGNEARGERYVFRRKEIGETEVRWIALLLAQTRDSQSLR